MDSFLEIKKNNNQKEIEINKNNNQKEIDINKNNNQKKIDINKNNNQKEIDIKIEKTKQIDKSIEYMKTCHSLFNNNNESLQKCIDKFLN